MELDETRTIPKEWKPIKFYESKIPENSTTKKLELIAKMSYFARKQDLEEAF